MDNHKVFTIAFIGIILTLFVFGCFMCINEISKSAKWHDSGKFDSGIVKKKIYEAAVGRSHPRYKIKIQGSVGGQPKREIWSIPPEHWNLLEVGDEYVRNVMPRAHGTTSLSGERSDP